MKQISFCITCMNRLKHLQETLEKNILDNFLVDEVRVCCAGIIILKMD